MKKSNPRGRPTRAEHRAKMHEIGGVSEHVDVARRLACRAAKQGDSHGTLRALSPLWRAGVQESQDEALARSVDVLDILDREFPCDFERNPGFVRHSRLPIRRWRCPECGVSMKGDMQRYAVTDGRCALCDLRHRRREGPALTPDEAEYLRATKRLAAGRNPSPSWHQDAAREYAGKLRADAAAGHDAADYWQGALAAESRALAMSNPVRWTFKDLRPGTRFIFESELSHPYSGMAKGPWFKLTARTYQHVGGGPTHRVGSINAEVIHTSDRDPYDPYAGPLIGNPGDVTLEQLMAVYDSPGFYDDGEGHAGILNRVNGMIEWYAPRPGYGYVKTGSTDTAEGARFVKRNPCGGSKNPGRSSRRRDYRRNPDSQLTEWIEGVLANDEEATDEELVDLFMSEGGLSPTEARAWVAKRGKYLAGVIDLKRRGKRNPDYSKIKGFEPWMANHPQFVQAVNKFVEFHGVMPESINKKDMPGLGNPGDKQFLVQMGKAMDTTYKPTHKGSSKYGSAYIHEFGEGLGRKPKNEDLPDQACTPDGKSIVTFGGKFEVKDWVRK